MESFRREIVELHQFFEGWLSGALPNDDPSFARLEQSLDDGFVFIGPGGPVTDRPTLVRKLRHGHGARRDLKIRIENARLHHHAGDLLVATYEEWQKAGLTTTGRISTVVFRRDDRGPHGLRWVHVHETWIE